MIRLNICNVKCVIIKAPRTKADKTGVKRVGAIDLGVNPLYTVHTSKCGCSRKRETVEVESKMWRFSRAHRQAKRCESTTTNETTVRPNDETIAIEVRKNACQLAELQDKVAPCRGEKDFWVRGRFDFESARLEEHFAQVKAVARWFRYKSEKEYADRSACDVCGQNWMAMQKHWRQKDCMRLRREGDFEDMYELWVVATGFRRKERVQV